jgi:hypothetical protein
MERSAGFSGMAWHAGGEPKVSIALDSLSVVKNAAGRRLRLYAAVGRGT